MGLPDGSSVARDGVSAAELALTRIRGSRTQAPAARRARQRGEPASPPRSRPRSLRTTCRSRCEPTTTDRRERSAWRARYELNDVWLDDGVGIASLCWTDRVRTGS